MNRTRFVILFLVLALGVFSSAWADLISVGSGTSTLTSLPISTYFGYSYSQQIYTPAQITTGGSISKISFYFQSGGNTNSSAWVIYMGHTTQTGFTLPSDWVPLANLTEVFNGAVTIPASGWMEITLGSAFPYDGVNNLVIAVDENTPNYASSSGYWYVFTSTLNSSISYRSDSTNPNPASPPIASGMNAMVNQLQLEMTTSAISNPTSFTATAVSSEQIDLAWTPNATPDPVMVAYNISNVFGTPVNGTAYAVNEVLAGGGTVLYNGTGTAYSHTSLTENTPYYYRAWSVGDDGTKAIAYSSGVGASATTPLLPISTFPWGDSFDGTFPPNGWTNQATVGTRAWDQQTAGTYPTCTPHSGAAMLRYNSYNSSVGNKAILVTPTLSFPDSNYRVNFWMFRDTGYATNADLVNVYYNSAPNTTDADLLGIIHRNATMEPVVAAQGWYNYIFNLPAGGKFFGYIIFEAVSAYGNNIFLDDIVIEPAPAGPAFSISPASWDFGQVELPGTGTQDFMITNSGGANLVLTSVDITLGEAWYAITVPPAMEVAPGTSTTFTVVYTPTAAEVNAGTITIIDNTAKGTHTVDLQGEGYIRPPGSTCGNPLPVTLPLEGFLGDTSLYGDDYSSTWITPTSYYLNGDDMVLQFTLDAPSTLSGVLTALVGSWIGMFVVQTEPNPTTPAPVLAMATASGTVATLAPVDLPAGTYFLILSTWPTPQSFQFSLDLTAVPLTNVPVELSSFSGTLTADLFVKLTWVSQSEANLTGYRVYRNTSNNQATAGMLGNSWVAATNTSTTQTYNLVDEDVETGSTYYYWLESVEYASSDFHGPVSVTVENANTPPPLPTVTMMKNAYPNPFRGGGVTNVEIALKAGETGTFTIYNILGQVVRTISLKEGKTTVTWDGKDSRGKACTSGLYFYKLHTPSFTQTRKVLIVK